MMALPGRVLRSNAREGLGLLKSTVEKFQPNVCARLWMLAHEAFGLFGPVQ